MAEDEEGLIRQLEMAAMEVKMEEMKRIMERAGWSFVTGGYRFDRNDQGVLIGEIVISGVKGPKL